MRSVWLSMAMAGILGITPTAAQAREEKQALPGGAFEGQVGVYWQQAKIRETTSGDPDTSGFFAGNAAVAYETAPWHGLSLGLGAWGSMRFDERNRGDYREAVGRDLVIRHAFLRFADDGLGEMTLGRQEIDLQWLTDYMEGGMARLSPLETLEIHLGWARRQAVTDPDETGDFTTMNGDRGLYVLDVGYSPLEWLELNPYYYHAPRLFQAPGLRATASFELRPELTSSTMAQWLRSDTHDQSGLNNGGLVWLAQNFTLGQAGLGAGYIRVDRQGAGGIDSFGDQHPFEEGNRIFSDDARTLYLEASCKTGPVNLTALYGTTRYEEAGVRVREKEFNLGAAWEIIPDLELELIYAMVDNDERTESYQTIKSALLYRF